MSEQPTFLSERQLQHFLGVEANELGLVAEWGLIKNPGDPGYREDRVRDWIELSAKLPGVFLDEKFAAALLGLSVAEFLRCTAEVQHAQTSFDDRLYWTLQLRNSGDVFGGGDVAGRPRNDAIDDSSTV
jgi:hypothetical protein